MRFKEVLKTYLTTDELHDLADYVDVYCAESWNKTKITNEIFANATIEAITKGLIKDECRDIADKLDISWTQQTKVAELRRKLITHYNGSSQTSKHQAASAPDSSLLKEILNFLKKDELYQSFSWPYDDEPFGSSVKKGNMVDVISSWSVKKIFWDKPPQKHLTSPRGHHLTTALLRKMADKINSTQGTNITGRSYNDLANGVIAHLQQKHSNKPQRQPTIAERLRPNQDKPATPSNTHQTNRTVSCTKSGPYNKQYLEVTAEDKIRDKIFTIPSQPQLPSLFFHQKDTISPVTQNNFKNGIIHIPTGGGKTRIGIELLAQFLRRHKQSKVLWVTDRKILLQQTMVRLYEAGSILKGKDMLWAHKATSPLTSADIVLGTIQFLKNLFRSSSISSHKILLVIDECHLLGAAQLQDLFNELQQNNALTSLSIIGLSATPLPTNVRRHQLLRKLFPIQSFGHKVSHEWGMNVYHSIERSRLVKEKILCPTNLAFEDHFSISEKQLQQWYPEEDNIKGAIARLYTIKEGVGLYKQTKILNWIAKNLANNLSHLQKVLVFLPRTNIADEFVNVCNSLKTLKGKVMAIHNGIPAKKRTQGIAKFKRDKVGVLVSVNMLTAGFDDPTIRTIVMARHTESTNQFWQMIGRGLRGKRVGGTPDCYVIDPMNMLLKHNFFGSGYAPNIDKDKIWTEKDRQNNPEYYNQTIIKTIPIEEGYGEDPHFLLRQKLQSIANQKLQRSIEKFLNNDPLLPEEANELEKNIVVKPNEGGGFVTALKEEQDRETNSTLSAEATPLSPAYQLRYIFAKELHKFTSLYPEIISNLKHKWIDNQDQNFMEVQNYLQKAFSLLEQKQPSYFSYESFIIAMNQMSTDETSTNQENSEDTSQISPMSQPFNDPTILSKILVEKEKQLTTTLQHKSTFLDLYVQTKDNSWLVRFNKQEKDADRLQAEINELKQRLR